MRIYQLLFEYPPYIRGGISRYGADLVQNLNKYNYEIHVFAIGNATKTNITPRFPGKIYVHWLNVDDTENRLDHNRYYNKLVIEKAIQLSKEMKEPDLIHIHSWLSSIAGIKLQKLFGVPLFFHVHSTILGKISALVKYFNLLIKRKNLRDAFKFVTTIEKRTFNNADKIIVPTKYMKDECIKLYGNISSTKVIIIPNGVNINKFCPRTLNKNIRAWKIGKDNSSHLILYVGRIVPEKGLNILIDAIPLISKEVPNIKVIIAGKAPKTLMSSEDYLNFLKRKIIKHNINNKVVFAGFIRDEILPYIYNISDLVVNSSFYEPVGLSILEAMASGKPVVATEASGIRDYIRQYKAGIIVKIGDIEQLSEAIIKLLLDRDMRFKMGVNGRKCVEEHFNWQKIAKDIVNLYDEFLCLKTYH